MSVTPLHIDNAGIDKLIERRRDTYLKDPLQIVSDYQTENANIDDYNGRQLLEMIQNANDECDTKKSRRVLIKLDEESLIIANNGNPFSRGGVESLMYSSLSPKLMEENKVGKKGLGFRSILNWTKEVYIASYDLHIKFSKEHAKLFLNNLISENPEIRTELNRKTKEEYPIAVLRCPVLEEDHSKKRVPEYDTVVDLALKEGVFKEIVNQIELDLIPEVLIFLNKIEEIEVVTPSDHFLLKKSIHGEKVILDRVDLLKPSKSSHKEWFLLVDEGELQGQKEKKSYELKIAYNPNEEVEVSKLFSYFRTEVDFPYPVIAHGSFELKSDRNHLIRDNNGFNELLLKKLARLLIKGALKLTESGESNYEALKLVLPTSNKISSLNDEPWHFDKILGEEIKNARIFPLFSGGYTVLNESTRFYPVNLQSVIPNEGESLFQDLLKYSGDSTITSYFQDLELELKYPDQEFTKKVNELVQRNLLSSNQVVDWIYKLNSNVALIYKSHSPELPDLLMDHEGNYISFGDEIVSPPDGETYTIPNHVHLSFIHKGQYADLKSRFGGLKSRDLIDRLKHYKITEYSMEVVLRNMVNATRQLLDQDQQNLSEPIRQMHRALFRIYHNIPEGKENKKQLPAGIMSPPLFTRNGITKSADQLYFGREYRRGNLMEALFVGVREDVFVADISSYFNGENIDQFEIENYLLWIGVVEMPRREDLPIKSGRVNQNEFIKSIVDNLKYPYSLANFGETFQDREQFNNVSSISCSVLWYKYLPEIIDNASIESILAWFLTDQELSTSLANNREMMGSEFLFHRPGKSSKRKIHNSDIPSYIRYYLQDKRFIPVKSAEGLDKVKVTGALIDGAKLEPLLKAPDINYASEIFIEKSVDQEQVEYILRRLGVKENLKGVDTNSLYGYLLIHHEYYEDNPKNILNFYTSIIEATKSKGKIKSDYPNRKKYLEEGKIFADLNGESKFVDISKATYIDNPNFSQDLLRKLSRAKLPMRSGNSRMQELFGVQPLDYIKFSVQEPVNASPKVNQQFADELNELKPFLFTYRFQKALSKSQESSELLALKRLKIKTCYDATINYKLNGVSYDLVLQDYEFIQDEESKIFYVKIPEQYNEYMSLKSDFRFKETVSDIISGALKVTENRKDFMLLLGESSFNWDKVLSREFDNFKELEKEILERFDGALSAEQKFWQTYFEASGIDSIVEDLKDAHNVFSKLRLTEISEDEFYELQRAFNFNNLSSFENVKLLILLFKHGGIDIHQFNSIGYKVINIKSYWGNKIYSLHKEFIHSAKSYYFRQGNKAEYQRVLESLEQEFDYPISNSISFDYKDCHKLSIEGIIDSAQYEIVSNTYSIDLEKEFQTNFLKLKEELSGVDGYNSQTIQDEMYNPDFRLSVLFGDMDEWKSLFKEKFKTEEATSDKITIGNSEVTNSDTDSILKQIENDFSNGDYTLEEHDMHAADKRKNGSSRGKKGRRQSTFSKGSKIDPSDIGFIGEKFAYELLKTKFDTVEWVSEYALKAGLPKGSDGLGYDFECRLGEETRFIEVKSTTGNDLSFNISENEILVGHEKHNVFDVILITKVLSNDRQFKYLKNIFEYKENENFLENSKFNVENDSYKIRFK